MEWILWLKYEYCIYEIEEFFFLKNNNNMGSTYIDGS